MFSGDTILFDGISSEEFGLMLVLKLDSTEQESGDLGPSVSISEDTILRSRMPIHYATKYENALEFKLVLSVIDGSLSLSRHDLAAIAGWLYGHQSYKTLVVCQGDLADYFYRCKVTEIEELSVGGRIVGLTVSVRCDAPYAYMPVANDIITCGDSLSYAYLNRSNVNDFYRPTIVIDASGGSSTIQITNATTGATGFAISDIPSDGAVITVDCQRQIITCPTVSNVYQYCNLKFPAFVRGINQLQLTGDFTLTINNEFPMYIGA